ncbi:MAG: right-handed parallel beta-helix repeat-containing protein [Candidatus Lokiarchaeota archaeon]|nr:right-handed parallel beta-helix repeat-containing protein [Candidatus Lokiarchaeota archaeon]
MKSNIKIVLFTLVILFLFSSMCKAFSNEEINLVEFNEEPPNQIEELGSWNLIGTTISVDNNWTAVEAAHDWCTGEGTESEPYLIENVTIDAQGSGSCIKIQNSNDYFIIQNCSLYHSGSIPNAGITLYKVTNGKIINNYCYSNYNGICMEYSSYNTVSGNNASHNARGGLDLTDCDNNTISGNIANSNYWGIALSQSDNNKVSDNTASYNYFEGISLWSSSDNNIVSGNVVSYNSMGIKLKFNDNNTVSGNTFSNNVNGIYMWNINNTMVSENTASYNDLEGIQLYYSYNNTIFLNYFTNNGQNAFDKGTNNMWDNGSIGNYWNDYEGVDANNDGIGDTPYLIPGLAGSQDNFPIWNIQPSIPFGNYFLLFTLIAILSLTILEKQKKKCHLR